MPQYLAVPQINLDSDTHTGEVRSTRFAPSPNGYLHMGHAYAAIAAHDFARVNGGNFYLRIEDIDGTRSRAEYTNAIIDDLKWLGLSWDAAPILQSARIDDYADALHKLRSDGLVYRCFCTRQSIRDAVRNKPVLHGPDGPIYPGTCTTLNEMDAKARAEQAPFQWRLNMAAACQQTGPLMWHDIAAGPQYGDPAQFGDIVLWRKDAPASYHLAATLDDARDGISHVVRGRDLFAYSCVHSLLQVLLNLPQPIYWHHAAMVSADGEKLAKTRHSPSLMQRRLAGKNGHLLAAAIREGKFPPGLSMSGA